MRKSYEEYYYSINQILEMLSEKEKNGEIIHDEEYDRNNAINKLKIYSKTNIAFNPTIYEKLKNNNSLKYIVSVLNAMNASVSCGMELATLVDCNIEDDYLIIWGDVIINTDYIFRADIRTIRVTKNNYNQTVKIEYEITADCYGSEQEQYILDDEFDEEKFINVSVTTCGRNYKYAVITNYNEITELNEYIYNEFIDINTNFE